MFHARAQGEEKKGEERGGRRRGGGGEWSCAITSVGALPDDPPVDIRVLATHVPVREGLLRASVGAASTGGGNATHRISDLFGTPRALRAVVPGGVGRLREADESEGEDLHSTSTCRGAAARVDAFCQRCD